MPIDPIPEYAAFRETFKPAMLEALLSGRLADGVNACVECCDRHAVASPDKIALNWEGRDGRTESVTFAQLKERSARFANVLRARGVVAGDRVAGLLPRIPDLLTVILGTWRAGAVYQPLFTAFGPKAIEFRVGASEARLVVTDAVNRGKLDGVAVCPPVLMVGATGDVRSGDGDFAAEMARSSSQFEPVLRGAKEPFLMLFTSGTTGHAKGVAVPMEALLHFAAYMLWAIDLRPEDKFWNIADPGWAYGLYYAVAGPLLLGQTTTFYDGPFTVDSTYSLIKRHGITNLAGAPTAFRLLMAAGPEPALAIKGQLRVVSSAGEPLNAEVIRWFAQNLDVKINDHYGQTEMAMVVCNYHALRHPIIQGSAGYEMPGFRVVVLDAEHRELPPGQPGILAVDRSQSPLFWFQGYWRQPTQAFVGPYYLSGDTVESHTDGSIAFVGRSDDIITSSGYRIGPFDVESSLIEHPSVAETAVIGKPDPERTEIVKAFVVLRQGFSPSPELAEELKQLVRLRLAAHAYPRDVEFVTELPKTPSGKIQRFLLRRREAGHSDPAS